jgi:hypothetical protein
MKVCCYLILAIEWLPKTVDVNKGNLGCDGGMSDQAFVYVSRNKGIDTEETYPYEQRV